MAYEEYKLLQVEVGGRECRVTIDNPPINLLDVPLMLELDRLGREVEADRDVGVLVVRSANPEFFVAHADVGAILQLPREALAEPPAELAFFHAMVDRFRTMPVATIAVVEGIARGGGCEMVSSFDIRVAAQGRAVFGQPESLIGIIPGGSGTQRLPRLVGRARAAEIVLGGADVDADTADRWGLVNRALPPDEVWPFVDALAARIASLPAVVVAEAKASLAAAEPDPVPGLLGEWQRFTRCNADPEAAERMEAFLAAGGQTADVERRPITLADSVWTSPRG
ncbi:MAG TPA: enoyl-CoA hydratase/isomerase family protein [Acidimicrobiales bacterium]|jgi:enoyl-CoA hydratase/carnithine racemase